MTSITFEYMGKRNMRDLMLASALAVAGIALIAVSVMVHTLPNSISYPVEDLQDPQLPPHWHVSTDSGGKKYYWNRRLGTSSWDPPKAVEQHIIAQPKLIVNSDVPVKLYPSPRKHLQSLAPSQNDGEEGGEESGEEDEDEPKIQDVSGQPDWPSDLPGAMGDDTSWIVGMHREPFWSDSMTHSCGLTTPCEKGRADRGHGFQKATNPWVDKRRTFDPYAQSSETGRKNYPWDPSKDPKYYGKADCSDGKLTKDCFEKPSDEDLEKKQAEWRAKYDEWHTGKGEDSKKGLEEKQEEEAEAAQQEQKKSSGGNAILHMPDEITPWAHSLKRGQLAMKEARGHFTGGEPVVKSLGRVVHKIQDDFASAKNMLSSNSFTTLEKKFLRAHSNHKTSAFHTKYQSTLQSLVSEPSAKFANRQKESASIWESPSAVKLHGVYGKGNKFAEESPKSEQRAAPKAASEVQKQAAIKGPLPSVRSDAEWVVSAEGKHAEHKGKASTKPWEETQIQKGVLRRENTLANLESAIEHHDNQLLQKQSGLTIPQLKALEKSAGDLEKKLMAKHEGDHGKGTKMPSLKVQHKLKVVRHLRDKVMAILAKREEELFSKKSGWKSEKDLDRAEKFAENLSLEIKRRRAEEKLHPLIPKDVLSVTKDQMKPDPALHLKESHAPAPHSFSRDQAKLERDEGNLQQMNLKESQLMSKIHQDQERLIQDFERSKQQHK